MNADNRQKVIVVGPALTLSGYGEQCRFALRSLRTLEDQYDIYLHATSWGNTGWIHEDNEEREWLDKLLHKTVIYTQQGGQFDMSLQVTIPNEWKKLAPVNVGYTAGIETTRVAPEWIEKSREMDRIIVVSNHSKEVYESTSYALLDRQTNEHRGDLRCQTPISVVNYPVKSFDECDPADLQLDFSSDFNFLCVAQMGPRKNVANTMKWFVQEFHDDENVGLVLKIFHMNTSTIDRQYVERQINAQLSEFPDRKCKIHLLHGHMSESDVHKLYLHPQIKGLVSLTHGEGYGLPIFEAAYSGLPVVAPAWSGQMDFLMAPSNSKKSDKLRPHFLRVDYSLKPVPDDVLWEGVITQGSEWCEPDQTSYKKLLRDLYSNHSRHQGTANRLKKHILENFKPESLHEQFCEAFAGEQSLDIDAWLSELETDVEEHE